MRQCEWTCHTDDLDKYQKHYVERYKQDRKEYELHCSIYMKFKNKQNLSLAIKITIVVLQKRFWVLWELTTREHDRKYSIYRVFVFIVLMFVLLNQSSSNWTLKVNTFHFMRNLPNGEKNKSNPLVFMKIWT